MSALRGDRCDSVPARMCVQAVDLSEFTECLADFMAVADEEIYLWAVHTACQLCALSEFSCWTLLTRNVIDTLLVRLNTAIAVDGQRVKAQSYTFQLVWRLFHCTDHPRDWQRVPTPSRIALRSLRYVLREEALVHTYPGHADNSLTNLAAVTLKMMHLFPDADYLNSGLLEDVIFYATLTEAIIAIHILPRFKSPCDHLQFKMLTLACLSLSPISTVTLKLFDQYKVAECLVSFLGDSPRASEVYASPENSITLFKCALPIVCALYDHLCQSFIDAGLIRKLIMFLSIHYLEEKNVFDALSRDVVKVLFFIFFRKLNTETTRKAFLKAEAVSVLLELCTTILARGNSLMLLMQSLLFHSLGILAVLMENDKVVQKYHGKTCLFIVNTLYQQFLKPLPTDSLIDNRLLVTASNFAWETLVWNEDNVSEFFSSGNLFSHIDILNSSPFSVQVVYLSVLVDICEYRKCIPYLVTWRGPLGLKLLSLLCQIWREEESRLGVSRNEQGCIVDIEMPLMGKEQAELVKQETSKSVSAYDVFGSVRPKIYAIVQLMHRYEDVKDLCEEHYRLGHDKLPCEDLVTLQVIEAYLPLKTGEIWWEIRNKQHPWPVVPLDRYLAETLARRYLDWSLRVQHAQHCILQEYNTRQRGLEQQFYNQAHSGQLTAALAALREVMAVARSADRQWLMRDHERTCDTIAASRARPMTGVRVAYPRPRDLNLILINSKADLVLDQPSSHHLAP